MTLEIPLSRLQCPADVILVAPCRMPDNHMVYAWLKAGITVFFPSVAPGLWVHPKILLCHRSYRPHYQPQIRERPLWQKQSPSHHQHLGCGRAPCLPKALLPLPVEGEPEETSGRFGAGQGPRQGREQNWVRRVGMWMTTTGTSRALMVLFLLIWAQNSEKETGCSHTCMGSGRGRTRHLTPSH